MLIAILLAAQAVQGVEVTVYNQNFGLVKEIRQMDLKKGISTVAVQDVAARIDPSTVHFRSLDNPDGVAILEQNYQFDLLSPNAVLEKSIGKLVRLLRVLPDGKKESLDGILLSPPSQGIIIKTGDGRYLLNPSGEIEVLQLPDGLISQPTLVWKLEADKGGSQRTELTYITDGIDWRADYVVTVNKDDNKLDLDGWVTLTNQSGATYRDARLKLVAGDVRRQAPQSRMEDMSPRGGIAAGKAGGFQESSLFEYHLYTLERPTTISNREVKQVSLLNATDVSATKQLIYEGQGYFWRSYGANYRPGEGIDTDPNTKVNVVLEVVNSKANNLGMPLPKGQVRVYKQDETGQLQFIGEDSIDHTPKDEKVRLFLGNAFDVVATRTRTDFRRISDNVIEQTYKIEVRNRKDTAVSVIVSEHLWGDWEVLTKSQNFEKVDAHTIQFVLNLAANQTGAVTYTERSRF